MKLHILNEQDRVHIKKWWEWLDQNRGDRAQLKRANSPDDILLSPPFFHFLHEMPEKWSNGRDITLPDAALVASVLAHVRTDSEAPFAKSLALPREGSTTPVMSELRFQQLQKSHTPDEFFRRMCRAIAMLKGKANIIDLTESSLLWLREHRTAPARTPERRLAVRWATDYYSTIKS